ncbi:MAG: aminodeoxychorismate lyase [Thermomonas sp.]
MNARVFRGDTRLDVVPADDRGLAYGDGLFETMRVHRGEVPWWNDHWSRLRLGAQRLGIPLPDEARVRDEAAALFADGVDGVLKLLLTRGAGERGYAPPATPVPTWIVSRHAVPAAPDRGLRLHPCETRLASQPALAGIKHCNRLEQILARAEADRAGADEGLVRDTDGNAIGATSANLFAFIGARWATPAIGDCGVAGVCRAKLLSVLDAAEGSLSLADIEAADAVFLCNAVRGILPVARLGAREWLPHPVVAAARIALSRLHPSFVVEPA